MNDFRILTAEEIVSMCKNFVASRPEPDPDHEGWRSELRLTPRMVEQILDANAEV